MLIDSNYVIYVSVEVAARRYRILERLEFQGHNAYHATFRVIFLV